MKKHKRSRSRSRSRSYSPSYKREKKYPKAYQNSGDFRGYHHGSRRPYNFRGRGRGYFPRGRFQRGGRGGGGGYNNNNYRNYWKNNKQRPPKQQQQQRYSQDGYYNTQKCSRSPTQSHSRHSDRSSTPLSRISHHSSPSSHSSSPKNRLSYVQANQTAKEEKEQVKASKDVHSEEDGDGQEKALVQMDDAPDGQTSEKTEGSQKGLSENNSPKRADPEESSAGVVVQSSQASTQKKTNEGDPSQTGGSSSTKKPAKDGLNPMLSSFDFFSSDEYTDADKLALSVAFKKFLEEQNKKSQTLGVTPSDASDGEHKSINNREAKAISTLASRENNTDSDGEVSLKCKTSPFPSNDRNKDETLKRSNLKSSPHEDEPSKQKVAFSGFGKWQSVTYSQSSSDHENEGDERYPTQSHDKTFAKKELRGNCEETSDKRSLAKSVASSIMATSKGRNPEREKSMNQRDELSFASLRRQEPKCNIRMDYFRENFIGAADILAEEREFSHSLAQSSKRDQEFRSIFQHVQTPHTQRLPTEMFAQHIVAIVHHVRAHHATPSGMSLSQRFAMYQRQAAEKEMMKLRKSPEIHRIIDVSPSAFKKNAQLFGAMKSCEDGTFKQTGEKLKGDPMDLRLDIERRKKSTRREKDHSEELGDDMLDYRESSGERSEEKHHKKSKKSKSKRCRSSSSSSSSSSLSQRDEDSLDKNLQQEDEAASRSHFVQGMSPGDAEKDRIRDKFQMRLRGRSWNKGNREQVSNSRVYQEDWDPEYTRGRKHYLHEIRDGGEESNWTNNLRGEGKGTVPRGRARFIIRNAPTGPNIQRSKWTSEESTVNRKQEGMRMETGEDETGGYINGGTS
ncbi:thyroid hormone receptor-associated protein 3 isoform X6 [Synchiropus splendidus]|uniref:thyroid hormone receptor-associated protein 3 isoform X6 n=1 Tax=Synchiropus splendidus TaxID=270530 RepID=UPI00237E6316|nr:thyroid hormone receptor-associated protein 3 isoform X6 [Synchiropus splendidus]